jgi:hypothetical protein
MEPRVSATLATSQPSSIIQLCILGPQSCSWQMPG